jgi:hypothetical protein
MRPNDRFVSYQYASAREQFMHGRNAQFEVDYCVLVMSLSRSLTLLHQVTELSERLFESEAARSKQQQLISHREQLRMSVGYKQIQMRISLGRRANVIVYYILDSAPCHDV